MNSFAEFLNTLGGLHDAWVVSFEWRPESKTFHLTLDDLYANFRGLSEYPGPQMGAIILRDVSWIAIEVDTTERLRVFEMLPVDGCADEVVARFSPSGRISVRFSTVEHPVNALLADNNFPANKA